MLCKFCENIIYKGDFCNRFCYWKWMKNRPLSEILSQDSFDRKQKIYEEKVYSKRRNHTYEEYYGVEKAKEVKLKQRLSRIGKKYNIVSSKKGKSYDKFYGIDRSREIRDKQSKAKIGFVPWNKNLSVLCNDSLKKFSLSNHFGYFNSQKTKKKLYYQSLSELNFLRLFSNIDYIKSIDRCRFYIPYFDTISNRNRRYTPDFDVILINNERVIVEVKPIYNMGKYNVDKFLALTEFAEKENYKVLYFPAISDKELEKYFYLVKRDLIERIGFEIMLPLEVRK